MVGRQGEFAAGNGAAMRIAPLAFLQKTDRTLIRDVCRITHKNDEAHCGALMVYYAIYFGLFEKVKIEEIIAKIINEIPDTRVRDRLIEISNNQTLGIKSIGQKFKPSGYVVDSVPFAIFAAQKIKTQSIESIFIEIIQYGGDTDTVCSMTGQIIGAHMGLEIIPTAWQGKIESIYHYKTIEEIVKKWPR